MTQATLNQPQLDWLEFLPGKVLESLNRKGRGAKKTLKRVIGGSIGSLSGMVCAWLARRRKCAVLVLTADEFSAEQLAADCQDLLGADHVFVNPPLDDGGDVSRALEAWGRLADRIALLTRNPSQLKKPSVVVSSMSSLLERTPSPEFLEKVSLTLKVGEELNIDTFVKSLANRRHRRVTLVESPGEFAVRGGILDVFPVGAVRPYRIELFGDEIDSLRSFEPATQRSIEPHKSAQILMASVSDYLSARRQKDSVSLLHSFVSKQSAMPIVIVDYDSACAKAKATQARGRTEDMIEFETLHSELDRHDVFHIEKWAISAPDVRFADLKARDVNIDCKTQEHFVYDLRVRLNEGDRVYLTCPTDQDEHRLRRILAKYDAELANHALLTLVQSQIGEGFRLPEKQLTLLTCAQLFDRLRVRRKVALQRYGSGDAAGELTSLGDLRVGQAVVHVVHGLGLFRGVKTLEHENQPRDQLVIEYRDKALLYVPVDRIGLVRHFIGTSEHTPKLSKLGGSAWKRQKQKAEKACVDLAADLLEVQAARAVQEGFAYPQDDDDMASFEASFAFQETHDQLRTMAEVKNDLETEIPMDRLICGDVGFGKTEVAMRAAFKVVSAGKQVALIAPTTVLAHQHAHTFQERFRQTPMTIDVISRFRNRKQQRETIKKLKAGQIDIVIGTHRLFSSDIDFKDLGLLVIDEEQKFGVAHKETLKAMRRTIDVLTMTATPIPRTLHMALSSVRNISVIASPPQGRIPVKSVVTKFSEALIERVIREELQRGGQVYVVHDRVATIEKLAGLVQRLLPQASLGVVHGRLDEASLEQTMFDFIEGDLDILVATKIIENGLDVPRANTLIVNRADRFGLSELHQIRGRVGRHKVQAYAYFLLPRHRSFSPQAERRLRAIEEFSGLGAGFRIALRDLEIRGAGHLLGAQQSGHIGEVGYDLYCRLLRKAVSDLRGRQSRGENLERGESLTAKVKKLRQDQRPQKKPPSTLTRRPLTPKLAPANRDETIDLELDTGAVEFGFHVPVSIPESYLGDPKLKIELYRKLSSSNDLNELQQFSEELQDRFGPLPENVKCLFVLRALRLLAVLAGVTKMFRQDRVVVIKFQDRQLLQAALYGHRQSLRFIDDEKNDDEKNDDSTAHLLPHEPEAPDVEILDFLLEAFSALDSQGTLRERLRFGRSPKPKRRARKSPRKRNN